jgi:hypothetical protein
MKNCIKTIRGGGTTMNRAPFITNERPAWGYGEPVTGRHMTYTMGYITRDNIPCMALFAGEDIDPVLIPVDILVHGIEMAVEKEQEEAAIAKANVLND